jgi:hypothetical protein
MSMNTMPERKPISLRMVSGLRHFLLSVSSPKYLRLLMAEPALLSRLKELLELFFMGLARGQRVNFPFAVEEHWVFAYDFREHFV